MGPPERNNLDVILPCWRELVPPVDDYDVTGVGGGRPSYISVRAKEVYLNHRLRAGAFQFTRKQHMEELMKYRKIERIIYNGAVICRRRCDDGRFC